MTRRCARCLLTLLLAGASPPAVAAPSRNEDSLRQLRLDRFVLPEFPEFVRITDHARGVVTVAIGRTAEGVVDDVLVLDSTNARLSQAVVDAVKQWRFTRPATQPPPGEKIVPIVRFMFAAGGVSVVSAPTGRFEAGAKSPAADVRPDAPVILPVLSELDSPPPPLQQPMPVLRGASHGLTAGSATVKFFVDENGRVRVPIVLEATAPDFGEAALAAVRQWVYEPPRVGDRPTIAIEVKRFEFKPTP